jgi:hypothetical protein
MSSVARGATPEVGSLSGRASPGWIRVAEQEQPAVVDDVALSIDLELAVARVAHRAGVVGHLEEAAAVDREVELVLGGADVALGELLGHHLQVGADADLAAAHTVERLRIHVGELGTRRLAAVGVRVGDVVADDLQVLAGRVQTRQALLEAHGKSPFGRFRGRPARRCRRRCRSGAGRG